MLSKIKTALADVIPPDTPMLVGVSGGPDSVALLHALIALGYRPHVCHYNHRWRGVDSDADEQFVRELAKRWDVPITVGRARQKPVQRSEMEARRARFAFFERAARRTGIFTLLLAHTADDQAETVLLRLIRGAGLHGLAGIWPDRQLGKLRVLRPMLGVWREEVLRYLQRHRLPYREDVTNRDRRWLRNRVREELLPLLERDYNPRIREVLWRTAEVLRAEVAAGPVAMERRAVRQLSFTQIEALRRVLHTSSRRLPAITQEWPVRVPGHTRLPALGLTVETSILPPTAIRIRKSKPALTRRVEYFDADLMGKPLIARTWRAGDRFQPLGMTGSKKLQDFFVDEKIPRAERDRVPLLCASDGRIAWVMGYRIADPFKVTATTRRVLRVRAISGGRSKRGRDEARSR